MTYKLKINGDIDFVVISPQMFSLLISKIHNSPERELAVDVDEIMAPGFAEYLLRVINTNRFSNEKIRYSYIKNDPVMKKDLYRILQHQFQNAEIQQVSCFDKVELVDTLSGNAEFDMECKEPFYWACKDSSAKFVYTFGDGSKETLVIEY